MTETVKATAPRARHKAKKALIHYDGPAFFAFWREHHYIKEGMRRQFGNMATQVINTIVGVFDIIREIIGTTLEGGEATNLTGVGDMLLFW